jgi:hypothetical protein
MTGSELMNMYEFSYGAITRNLDGVTHEESLFIPEPAGNCINWVVGHVVAARNTVLTLAGGSPVFTSDAAGHYRRGSAPIQSGDPVLDLGTLRGILADSSSNCFLLWRSSPMKPWPFPCPRRSAVRR